MVEGEEVIVEKTWNEQFTYALDLNTDWRVIRCIETCDRRNEEERKRDFLTGSECAGIV